jgi:hypothetical protein
MCIFGMLLFFSGQSKALTEEQCASIGDQGQDVDPIVFKERHGDEADLAL